MPNQRETQQTSFSRSPIRSMTSTLRNRLLSTALIVCLQLCALAQVAPATAAKHASRSVTPLRLFSPSSVWNKRLPANSPLDPTSTKRSDAFSTEIQREISAGTGPWISDDSYSTPIYEVGAGQRLVPVKLDTGSWGAPLQAVLDQGVPIPANAVPAAGSDGHMTIYQRSTDRLWELWRANEQSDGWHASWGGVMQNVSKSSGYYSDDSWSNLSSAQGWNWGSTASSLPVAAGTITIDDLRSGRINHALALNIPAPCADVFSWPAQRTDGTSKADNCLPEGAHLRIDPDVDLSKLGLPPISLMIAKAAQKYGIIVRDKTGHATGFFAEDPTRTGGDPYHGRKGLYDGLDPWEFLPQLPWDRVELLKMNLCTESPCEEPGR